MNSAKDQVFAAKQKLIRPFQFDEEVTHVFDDMVSRSVPFYQEVHRICADLALRYYKGDGPIIDLGCSTGTTINLLHEVLPQTPSPPKFLGIDSSAPMIKKAQDKCSHIKTARFVCSDMCDVDFQGAEIVILNYTLQFLSLDKRLELLRQIHRGLRPGGIIILSEKIHSSNAHMQELITDLYYDFKKRNGYSELEISQKREALENVLITLNPHEQIDMMKGAGFKTPEMIFRWYNFSTYLGIKEHA